MEKKPMFYGGKVGPWIPVLLMLAGMLASTIIGGGGLNRHKNCFGCLLCKKSAPRRGKRCPTSHFF